MARRCRVYTTPSGHVRIVNPNWNRKPVDMTDDEFTALACDKAEAGDPTLQGLPKRDVLIAALPFKVQSGTGLPTRNAWRVQGATVVIDQVVLAALPTTKLRQAEDDYNVELDKPSPDPVRLARLARDRDNHRLESGKTFDDPTRKPLI